MPKLLTPNQIKAIEELTNLNDYYGESKGYFTGLWIENYGSTIDNPHSGVNLFSPELIIKNNKIKYYTYGKEKPLPKEWVFPLNKVLERANNGNH